MDPKALAEPLEWVEQPSFEAGPPLCRCNRSAVRHVGRWWCAAAGWGGGGDVGAGEAAGDDLAKGCGFELSQRVGQRLVPLCACGRVATFVRGFYYCDAGICDLEHKPYPPSRVGETLLSSSALSQEAAKDTAVHAVSRQPTPPHPQLLTSASRPSCAALTSILSPQALLTASAFGPISAWAFVAQTDCGLGLHARAALQPGQFICEYGGPRIFLRHQKTGSYVLEVREH